MLFLFNYPVLCCSIHFPDKKHRLTKLILIKNA